MPQKRVSAYFIMTFQYDFAKEGGVGSLPCNFIFPKNSYVFLGMFNPLTPVTGSNPADFFQFTSDGGVNSYDGLAFTFGPLVQARTSAPAVISNGQPVMMLITGAITAGKFQQTFFYFTVS